MSEQRESGDREKRGNVGGGHKVNACMLYNRKTETFFSLLNNSPLVI